MEGRPCIFLGIKVKPGPIERFKLDNYTIDNTVSNLKTEAEKKTKLPSSSLELIHHGWILRDSLTLQASGVKNGEMVHVVKKKEKPVQAPPPRYTDAELQQLNSSLRTLGCTPNAPGWTRAMQLLNEEAVITEIIDRAPTLTVDCVALSILHEVELLAALGANIQTMRTGADAHHELPVALRHLTRLVRARASTAPPNENVPTTGFAYSLEALSEDEDADEEATEDMENNPITHEQLAAALQQAATDALAGNASASDSELASPSPGRRITQQGLLRLVGAPPPAEPTRAQNPSGGSRGPITPEMFSEAITEAMTRAMAGSTDTPMDQTTEASSSLRPELRDTEYYAPQLTHMHEMGLLDDGLNIRALLISGGDVNAAINVVFSGVIGNDDDDD